jgi:hypothetical protein
MKGEFGTMETKSGKGAMVWGGLLIILGGVLLVETLVGLSAWVWVAALALSGLGVLGIYFTDTSQRWILIPAYALFAIAILVALITLDVLQDNFIATYVLTVIALPFLMAFLRNQEQWWALIPTYILLAVGVMVGLIGERILRDLLIPAYVLLAIAIPFFVVYVRDTKQWWALIPGGITAIIGVSFLLAEGTFKYVLPAIIILIGGWILVRQFIRQEAPVLETPATTTIDADEPPSE